MKFRRIRRFFQNKNDLHWNAWLDLKGEKEPRDLHTLLGLDVRKEFKLRAITVLLAPDLRALPFRWDNTSLGSYASPRHANIEMFPHELLHFAGKMVCRHIDTVRGQRNSEAFSRYSELILQLLARLPANDEVAGKLFSRYNINDLVAYDGIDDGSGYNPLRHIFCAQDVPMKWKCLADAQMREHVAAEMAGREQPRKEWEAALGCYTRHIETCNYKGNLPYSRELFASQIRFITELPGIENYDQALFGSWQVAHAMDALQGDELHETRHKLARLIVLRKVPDFIGFSVHDAESRRGADLMLREFAQEDPELATKITSLLTAADSHSVLRAQAEHAERQKAVQILSQMR